MKPATTTYARYLMVYVALVFLAFQASQAQVVSLPNSSFEEGQDKPTGWTLSEGEGTWAQGEAADGERAVTVIGEGRTSNFWRSGPLALRPSSIYQISFRARTVDGGGGGTPITGPIFCNRDLGGIPKEWKRYSSIFVTPEKLSPENAWIRFGQWQINGTLAYDAIELVEAQPIHAEQGGIVLGEGEVISGNRYEFAAPYHSLSRNYSRPLAHHNSTFNTYRWVFGAGSSVVYRHEVAGRRQTAAEVQPGIGYYVNGQLLVEASTDGKAWRELGVYEGKGEGGGEPLAVPAGMLPAKTLWIRLTSRAKHAGGKNSGPGSFQISSYAYTATLDGAPLDFRGSTKFVAISKSDPRAVVAIDRLGDGIPGGDNTIEARIKNTTDKPLEVRPSLTVVKDGKTMAFTAPASTLKPGGNIIRLPYDLPGSGGYEMGFSLGADVPYTGTVQLHVPELFDNSYGEQLPGSSPQLGLWWASSGWKISQSRPAPEAASEAMVIRAARNESEAAQLVLRPAADLRGLIAEGTALEGPAGQSIPVKNVEVLRVRYVPVTRPTDATGVAAPWPDPLPPFKGPINVAAGTNQPLWVRVNVPAGQAAGVYSGAVKITAEGVSLNAPLQVEVYDFDLPTRMTCVTAFGFDPNTAFHYQNVPDADTRRAVLDKYLQNYSAHHISPYNPTPLDGFGVSWPGLGKWKGGRRDSNERHSGTASLLLEDTFTNRNVDGAYADPLTLPEKGGLRLRLAYKTKEPGMQALVSLMFDDGNGQWLSGRNMDIRLKGDGSWQTFDQTITAFPAGAKTARLALRAAPWADAGTTTGTIWYDDVSIQAVASGQELLEDGGFDSTEAKRFIPEFDWTAWDAAMERAIDEYGFNSFRLPVAGLGGGTFHSRYEPVFLGYPENTPEYQIAFRNYIQGIERHLKQKGWLDEAYVYWFDEPDPKDYEFVMNGFNKIKKNAPGINRMLTEQLEPELLDGPNIWCPLTPSYDYEAAEERRAKGDIFWWYVCTGPKAPYATLFIDHPGTEMRVWLWQTWQDKVQGILVWQSNYWTSNVAYPDHPQNPYDDPMGWVTGYSTPKGTRRPWGNGDGRFIYPPEAAADVAKQPVVEGPVDSIRWEMLRDGIEDYEYFVILEGLLKKKGEALAPGTREAYEDLLDVPATVSAGLTDFTKDPAPLEAHRDALARAIAALRKTR